MTDSGSTRDGRRRARPILIWTIVAVLVALPAAWLGVRGLLSGVGANARWADPDPRCDIASRDCTLVLPGGGEVRLAVAPRDPIPLVTPLRLQVVVTGRQVESVAVDFIGVDMEMGYNRARLAPLGAARFAGETMLPVCARTLMRWEARVLLETPDGLLVAPFRFETRR
ncbi:hypothetical protein MARPU_02715 [Marichromatium purpuratum 984]|uniref:Uncharacterized protein n=1 Tax=Marichromatium purpuratum 984 TaxID=765910 RepID=W0E101_MARPU|nr:hypothetical protein [Marichromatium purpuratum]AHF02899.1 hypothetical protein MARPU_02715 [Marichromatium purpuratum 984]